MSYYITYNSNLLFILFQQLIDEFKKYRTAGTKCTVLTTTTTKESMEIDHINQLHFLS